MDTGDVYRHAAGSRSNCMGPKRTFSCFHFCECDLLLRNTSCLRCFGDEVSANSAIINEISRLLLLTGVGVEKVRDRNVFSAAMIATAECFLLTSAKRRLPQWGLSSG